MMKPSAASIVLLGIVVFTQCVSSLDEGLSSTIVVSRSHSPYILVNRSWANSSDAGLTSDLLDRTPDGQLKVVLSFSAQTSAFFRQSRLCPCRAEMSGLGYSSVPEFRQCMDTTVYLDSVNVRATLPCGQGTPNVSNSVMVVPSRTSTDLNATIRGPTLLFSVGEVCTAEGTYPYHGIKALFPQRLPSEVAGRVCCDSSASDVVVVDGRLMFSEAIDPQLYFSFVPVTTVTTRSVPRTHASRLLLCGHDISEVYTEKSELISSGIIVAFDWDQYDVALPGDIFSGLSAWANVSCNLVGGGSTPGCFARGAPGTLPMLTLEGTVISIDLNLLVNESDPQRRMAVLPTSPGMETLYEQASAGPAHLVLGSVMAKVLSFGIFQNVLHVRPSARRSVPEQCATRVVCEEDEQYLARTNRCLNAKCALYLMKTFDADKNECRVNGSLVAIFVILVILAILGEVVTHTNLLRLRDEVAMHDKKKK